MIEGNNKLSTNKTAEERLRLDPVVRLELLERLVVRALRVGRVAERGARLLLLAGDRRAEERGAEEERGGARHRQQAFTTWPRGAESRVQYLPILAWHCGLGDLAAPTA